jgi:hypothetical protein
MSRPLAVNRRSCVKERGGLWGVSQICLWCIDIPTARAEIAALEAAGSQVVAGCCPDCIAFHHADSLRGGSMELRLAS